MDRAGLRKAACPTAGSGRWQRKYRMGNGAISQADGWVDGGKWYYLGTDGAW